MSYAKLPVACYKIVDNEEVFVRNDILYVEYNDYTGATSGSSYQYDTVTEAINEYNARYSVPFENHVSVLYFYDTSSGNPYAYMHTVERSKGMIGEFGCIPFDITPFIGYTARLYVTDSEDDMYIQFDVDSITFSQSGYNYTSSLYVRNLTLYKNGVSIGVGMSSLPITQQTGTSTTNSYLRDNLVSFPFVDISGAYVTYHSFAKIYNLATSTATGYILSLYKTSTTYPARWVSWLTDYDLSAFSGDNPYAPGGTDQRSNSTGNFSEDSDTVTTDNLPTLTAIGTGFATLFTPSRGQLQSLAQLFWNGDILSFLQNSIENISDMFIGLSICPFTVTAGSTVSVTWLGIDTAVSLTLAADQFVEMDMGTIDLSNDTRIFTSGSALDYSPFSKLGIYLPFIGTQQLDIDELRGTTVNLRYRVDLLSGACVAILRVNGTDLYQFSGAVLTQIPITNQNMQSLISDVVNVGISAAAMYSAGAAGAAATASEAAKEGLTGTKILTGSNLATTTANAMMNMKPTYNKSGSISSSASLLGVKQPYLFLSTPRQSIPSNYNHFNGFPSNIRAKLGDLDGFTQVESIVLENLGDYTIAEIEEIERLLKEGVYI